MGFFTKLRDACTLASLGSEDVVCFDQLILPSGPCHSSVGRSISERRILIGWVGAVGVVYIAEMQFILPLVF